MGHIHTNIVLSNPRHASLAPMEVEALVDTGAATLCIPEHVAVQLNLETLEQREVTTADGKRRTCDYVGPVQVRFGNRACFVGALVLGNFVLLGAIPLEDMDLVVHPLRQTVTVNPDSPNMPSAIVAAVASSAIDWRQPRGHRPAGQITPFGSSPRKNCPAVS